MKLGRAFDHENQLEGEFEHKNRMQIASYIRVQYTGNVAINFTISDKLLFLVHGILKGWRITYILG